MANQKNQKTIPETQAQTPQPQTSINKPEPEKVLFSWKAPSRPFKKRDKEFWVSTIAIAAIFGIIIFIIEGAMPVILIIAVIFLYFILSTVEPEQIEYFITTRGVKIVDKTTNWNLLTRYWFTQRLGSHLLILETIIFPGRLELVINQGDKEKIKKELDKYLTEEEAPPTNLDKVANWFARKMPGNK